MRAKKQSTPSKKTPAQAKPPTDAELKAVLGKAGAVWSGIVRAMKERFAPFEEKWRPSQAAFGRACLLRRKDRTLLYLIPGEGQVLVIVALGERAFQLAMASSLPAAIKKMLAEAKPHMEGRFIRFPVTSADVPTIVKLVELKMTPK